MVKINVPFFVNIGCYLNILDQALAVSLLLYFKLVSKKDTSECSWVYHDDDQNYQKL